MVTVRDRRRTAGEMPKGRLLAEIMPDRINPTQSEALTMGAVQVWGHGNGNPEYVGEARPSGRAFDRSHDHEHRPADH
jgi:hypothetical protein